MEAFDFLVDVAQAEAQESKDEMFAEEDLVPAGVPDRIKPFEEVPRGSTSHDSLSDKLSKVDIDGSYL